MYRKTIEVKENQRVLMYQDHELKQVLKPGRHRFWDFQKKIDFESFDINDLFFNTRNTVRVFEQSPALAEHVVHWKLDDQEVGLLYLNQQLRGVVAPGEHLFVWKDAGEFELKRLDISATSAVDSSLLNVIKRRGVNTPERLIKSELTTAVAPIKEVTIEVGHRGLLYLDGELQAQEFGPGHYGFWQFGREVEVYTFDMRNIQMDISGQEILSKDKVSLRINLSAMIRVTDMRLASEKIGATAVDEFIYRVLQLALREAVGTKTLDELLVDKLYVNETVRELVQDELASAGLLLERVGVRDIILPGEMKTILNQVVEAQKAAEANVIKRREETAATRSLHNTAKVMEDNPTLMRLKELEALEKIAEKIDSLTIYGGLENLMNGTIKIGPT